MKRIGNLFDNVCSVNNLIMADELAREGKSGNAGVIKHDKTRGCNIISLHNLLMDGQYQTSPYHTFVIREEKERLVYDLPFYPDRIVHHAIMNHLEKPFVRTFTTDTYSSIKGRGIHQALGKIKRALKDKAGTQYCLKIDITKFYPSVDHDVLKDMLRLKIKDARLLAVLDEIIDSADGLPIGNYLSQYLANYYLAYFDHWIKEVLRVKYYFRYADDMILLGATKPELHALLAQIRQYLTDRLKLAVKGNYQVFPVNVRGIDTLGYVIFHTHVLLRKRNKKKFARLMKGNPTQAQIAAHVGWAMHCNSRHLLKKLLPSHEKIWRPQYSAG